jgi:IS30 family transposase
LVREVGHLIRNERHSRAAAAARSIPQRPPEVDGGMEFGHWEMDAVAGGVGTSEAWLMTITERRTRFGITRKIGDRTMRSVAREPDVLERQMGVSLFQGMFKTVTGDNGSEFSDMEGMERSALSPKRRLTLCFSHPYGSFEWGTNGNHNGIIRRFIPKGSDIGICTRSSPPAYRAI